MRFAILIEEYVQCSPDDFKKVRHIKEIHRETTIGEIVAWQKGIFPRYKDLHLGITIKPMLIQKME